MRLKDIRQGEVYAVVRYFDHRKHAAIEDEGRLEAREYDEAWSSLGAARVLEVGVPVQHYSRPGVKVQWLDRETMEPRTGPDGEPLPEEGLLAANVLLPWQRWVARYHEHVDERREAERRRREEYEREKARKREKKARDWMAREFAGARQDIAQVCAVLGGDPDALADIANFAVGDVTDELRDRVVRALVELRHPDGNPYLNGSAEAF